MEVWAWSDQGDWFDFTNDGEYSPYPWKGEVGVTFPSLRMEVPYIPQPPKRVKMKVATRPNRLISPQKKQVLKSLERFMVQMGSVLDSMHGFMPENDDSAMISMKSLLRYH